MRPARAAPNLAIHPAQTAMTNITAASTKADIITAAMEITDSQQAKIDQLQQRQVILFGLIALLSIINLLG
jgi:cell division protein FtsB